MNDYTPKSDKAEWHLTYRCDLACAGCNRACFLPAQTPDMTLEDASSFCRQAIELGWSPRIIIIGGEPTLHPEFMEFLVIARQFAGPIDRIEVWSNAFSNRARSLLAAVKSEQLATVIDGTAKRGGSVVQPVQDIFIAPRDFGATRAPCGTHACVTDPDCGISVDSLGYTVCCMGGAIDGVLGLGVRTRRLSDLFDPAFAAEQTRRLCENCGQHLGVTPGETSECRMVRGTLMSPTWLEAVDRITGAAPCP